MVSVKICGLSEPNTLRHAVENGAKFIGLVFHPASPRFVTTEQAKLLSRQIPTGVRVVGLLVNPIDEELAEILAQVPLDMIQLHGNEPPERVVEIKEKYSLQVMKAIRVADESDLEQVGAYEEVVDWLLFDTKVSSEYGGSGKRFDWTILKDKSFKKPWMLAGGLSIDNIEEALSVLHPDAVDVSSGVEEAKGVKDAAKVKSFLEVVKSLTL